jgi:purine-binding chemotaxis protein CheW
LARRTLLPKERRKKSKEEKEEMGLATDNKNQPKGTTGAPGQAQPQRELLQLVGFRVDGEEYGLDIVRVQEIIRPQHLTRVPNSPDAMDGVMNLRGKIIPVIALRKRFGLEHVAGDKQTRIIVVETRGTVLGFIVDSVSEVLRIPSDTVMPPPHLDKVKQEYVSGVGKLDDRLLILLNVDQLMRDDDLAGVSPAHV